MSPFTKAQKTDALLVVLSGKQTVGEVCREIGISAQTFAGWREHAPAGMEDALADKDDRSRSEAESSASSMMPSAVFATPDSGSGTLSAVEFAGGPDTS